MSYYIEIEYSNPDDESRTEAVGPFRSREGAARYADSLGKSAGMTQNNPDVPGFWIGVGEYTDEANGWHQDVTVTVMIRRHIEAKVRPSSRSIRAFLRGEPQPTDQEDER